MSELNKETFYGKISNYSRSFNKLDQNEIKEAIEMVQTQFEKEMRNKGNIHLDDGKLDIPYVKLKKEPIEYVIEEAKEEER